MERGGGGGGGGGGIFGLSDLCNSGFSKEVFQLRSGVAVISQCVHLQIMYP